MDEIVRAVRDCPSGALSFAIDDIEARAQVDWSDTREPTIPAPDEPLTFDRHIQPLFRDRDRRSMLSAFDLWSRDDVRDDVRDHAAAILDRLRAGTMPRDGAWPAERIDVVSRWIDQGCP
jgi:hypothetical protein